MKRYQKNLLSVLAAILIVFGGIQIYFNFFLDDHLEATLISRFNTATNNAYNLDIGEVDLRVFGRQLQLGNVEISTNPDSVDHNLQASLDAITVRGIGFLQLLWSQELSLREIALTNPSIYFTAPKPQTTTDRQPRLTSYSQRLSEITLQVLENVTIPRLIVRGFSLKYDRAELPVSPLFSFEESYIRLQDITIDSTLIKDQRILPADNISTVFRDIQLNTPNELYTLSAKELSFNSSDQQMDIRSVTLSPRYPKDTFARKVGHETDRTSLTVDEVQVQKIDIERLNKAESITAQTVAIRTPDIEIYRDKRLPFPPNNRPPLPHQMVRNIPFPVNIDTLSISEGNIRYSERVPKAEEAGYITFTDLKGQLYPLSNIKKQAGDQPMVLTAETYIMDQAKLQANFNITSTQQRIEGSLNSMDMTSLNKALVPMAFVRIDEGKIQGMDFEMSLSPTQASGKVTMRYENLKISLLDKGADKETFGNKVKSLLANTFAVKSSNTGANLRSGKIEFERNPQKSVFNYWWKSLLSGLKTSIGL